MASHLIEDNADNFPLSTITISGKESIVKNILLKKHPLSQPPKPPTVVSPSTSSLPSPFHPVLFEDLDGVFIQ